MTETVLLIEDEASIRRFVRASLENAGFEVIEAVSGQMGLALAASKKPSVILLDLGLPDIDGLRVVKRIREWATIPIIIISARGREGDKVAGLDAGADDYLTKPFSVAELLARIRVSLRHAEPDAIDAPVFESGKLKVDMAQRYVWIGGKEIHLSPIQYKLLTVLVRHAGKVVTHHQLLKEAWGPESDAGPESVRIYVHQLRRKIEADPVRPKYLKTESGVGYRLISND